MRVNFGRKKTGSKTNSYEQMVEGMPISVMLLDLKDFTITYANKSSIDALRSIEHALPVKADDIVGQCVDVFHKNPAHQRRLLSDPKNLPYQTRIEVAGETLDLLVSPLYDANGRYEGPMLTWSVITDQVRIENETNRLMKMLDVMPINIMLADKDSMEITYINKTSTDTLRPLQQHLPARVDELQGTCIDIFHKNPSHQRNLLSDPSRLPHQAVIDVGPEKLKLDVAAIMDDDGSYIAPMVSWSVITANVQLADKVAAVASAVSAASTEMQASAGSMSSSAESANEGASAVSAACEQLSASIAEIAQRVNQSSELAREGVQEASRSSEMINGLATTAESIGNVVNLIQDIAEQTNLLALNATIEAARAGEAGKGFAVVASEVKNLANQTAKATEEIGKQINEIQSATGNAVDANGVISNKVQEIEVMVTEIAAAIEEQNAATTEMNRSISSVASSSQETGQIAGDVNGAASELAERAAELEGEVSTFIASM